MANKKKSKKANGTGTAVRPDPKHQDSMRQDIETARAQLNQQHLSDGAHDDGYDDGLDIADQLLATLDARDKAAEQVRLASVDEERDRRHHVDRDLASSPPAHQAGTSPLKSAGEKLLHVGEKMFHGRRPSSSSSPTSPRSQLIDEKGDVNAGQDMQRRGSIRRLFGASSPPSHPHAEQESATGTEAGKKKVPRQKARMERKAAEMEAQRLQAEEELKANGGKPDEAERERVAITELCQALGVQMHEINPDGHCLYAAIADQINLLDKSGSGPSASTGKLTYADTRKAAANYMRAHADDFMPFISDSDEHMAGIENREAGTKEADVSQQEKYFLGYCDAVEKTAVWGGQPEILALSRAFETPIHVVQAGSPVYKVGTEEAKPGQEPVVISYHRHMYGLGEHYNSLHKVKQGGGATVSQGV